MGVLWRALLRRRKGLPPTPAVRNLILGDLEFATTGWQEVEFNNCRVESLRVDANGRGRIRLKSTTVDVLHVQGDVTPQQMVIGEDAHIDAILAGTFYHDAPRSVRNFLGRTGLIQMSPSPSDMSEAFEYFLKKICSRYSASVVVMMSNSTTDDPRLSWTNHYGADPWLRFIGSLIRIRLAELLPFEAGGTAKGRLNFLVPPAAIASKDDALDSVRDFWASAKD